MYKATDPAGAKPEKPGSATGESREYPSQPFVGVGVVVLKDDSVLLIRRVSHR